MHKDDNDHRLIMKIVMKNQTRNCCDGVNITILVWKGNKFVERKKLASVCFLASTSDDKWFILLFLIYALKGDNMW